MSEKLLIIGCGNMAGAMLAGWLAAGVPASRFAILNRTARPFPEGVRVFESMDAAIAADWHDAIMLGFKPQQLGDLAPQFAPLAKGAAVHSLLAGITLAQLRGAFPQAAAHLRVMPNLASRINKSPVILMQHGLAAAARDPVFAFYDRLGTAVWLEDEGTFDLATALAGSGPGFVYRFIDALAQAGAALGLERQQAADLATAMVDGASSLAAGSELSPADLADRVASPGGMTREGMNVLDANDALLDLLKLTLDATARRGAQLSAGAD